MIFHQHLFTPIEKDSEMLYCRCGEVKDIHRHIWGKYENIINNKNELKIGETKICKICGELKNFRITD